MPLHRRYQYPSSAFTPIHDWVLDCTPIGWGTIGWGTIYWGDTEVCTPERMGWLPVFPDFARGKPRLPYLMAGTIEAFQQLVIGTFQPPELSWMPHFPDIVRADFRQPHLEGGEVRWWLSLSALLPPGLGWLPDYPVRIYRPKHHPAYNPPFTWDFRPILTDVAQFPMLYMRQPTEARVWAERTPHLLPFFFRRTQDVFGVWTEPGITPVVTSWTEPGIAPIVTSWTEPGVTPITSTWTEPAVTPITPSPDRNT